MVRELGKPFRSAHHIAGTAVKLAESKGVPLSGLSLEDFRGVDPDIREDVFSVLSARASMESRTSYGGTAPVRVKEQVARWRARLQGATS